VTLETQAAFARRLGKDRAHVTRLKQAGRLVMQGKRVVVEASLERLEATESPEPKHQAVAAHYAEQRTRPAAPDLDTLAAAGLAHKQAVARKAAADAELAEMQRDQLAGRLVEATAVAEAIADALAIEREALFNRVDRLVLELPSEQQNRMRSLWLEALEEILNDTARALGERAGEAAA